MFITMVMGCSILCLHTLALADALPLSNEKLELHHHEKQNQNQQHLSQLNSHVSSFLSNAALNLNDQEIQDFVEYLYEAPVLRKYHQQLDDSSKSSSEEDSNESGISKHMNNLKANNKQKNNNQNSRNLNQNHKRNNNQNNKRSNNQNYLQKNNHKSRHNNNQNYLSENFKHHRNNQNFNQNYLQKSNYQDQDWNYLDDSSSSEEFSSIYERNQYRHSWWQ